MSHFEPVIGRDRLVNLYAAADATRRALAGRTVWNVNSTGAGGGVAELLQTLLPYARGLGVDARWIVIAGDPEFFVITKRLCNGLYGVPGDGGPLDQREHFHYKQVSQANAEGLLGLVRPGDIVVLHDPHTAGLVRPVRQTGAVVVWRGHTGHDTGNEHVTRSWGFLRPYLEDTDAFVFSRTRHIPAWVDPQRAHVIVPSIDPFWAKNIEMDLPTVQAVLTYIGLLQGARAPSAPTVTRADGSPIRIRHRAVVIRSAPAPSVDTPLVVQVSRWDRLKDMLGVMRAFAEHIDDYNGAHLTLVGPEVGGVADDPEARVMLDACYRAWRGLPSALRARIQLVCLPMTDVEENAVMVNAVQRHATVIVQKSLAEGFGLTVTEAMWKSRPVVASAVGGITDQIVHGEHGLLVEDPNDLRACADATSLLLGNSRYAEELGHNARSRVTNHFLGDRHLIQYAHLIERLVSM